jgi:hypothetical protein
VKIRRLLVTILRLSSDVTETVSDDSETVK